MFKKFRNCFEILLLTPHFYPPDSLQRAVGIKDCHPFLEDIHQIEYGISVQVSSDLTTQIWQC